MPLPSSINDLSTVAASNSPAGSEAPSLVDDYLRTYASYIAALRDVVLAGTGSVSTANITYTGTLTGGTGVVNIGSGQIYKSAAGNVGYGTTTPIDKLHVVGAGRFATGANAIGIGADANGSYIEAAAGAAVLVVKTSGVERLQFDAAGNTVQTLQAAAPTFTVARQMSMNLVSDTQLRISVRGSDGVTRLVNLTLA